MMAILDAEFLYGSVVMAIYRLVSRATRPRSQRLFTDGELLNEVTSQLEAAPRRVRGLDKALRRDFHLRFDDVFFPVAFGSGDVSGQSKVGKGRRCDILSPANACLQHAAARHVQLRFL